MRSNTPKESIKSGDRDQEQLPSAASPSTDRWLRRRQLFFVSSSMALLLLIAARFMTLQIFEHEKWQEKARRQHLLEKALPAKRGSFLSAQELYACHAPLQHPFAKDLPVYHLFLDSSRLKQPGRALLKNLLLPYMKDGEQKEQLERALKSQSKSRRLLSALHPRVRAELGERWNALQKNHKIAKNTLFFLRDFVRVYPQGDSSGHLLQAVAQYKDPLTHYTRPIGGLELLFHQRLTGRAGKMRLTKTLKNPLLDQQEVLPAHRGEDLYLSLHPQLQSYAEQLLAWGVARHRAKAAWAVVACAQSGQIFALAQYPRLDPRFYSRFFSEREDLWKTRVWAIQDAHEPGSIMKPIFLAIALKANRILEERGETQLFDPDEWLDMEKVVLKGRKKKLKDTSVGRYLNMNMALKKSSNLYMASLAQKLCDRLGALWFAQELAQFGFGTKSAIEFPGQAAGLLPWPGKKYPSGALQWSLPTAHSLSMGHSILVTSMQMVRAYCMLANGGYSVEPSLLLGQAGGIKEGRQEREQRLDPAICQRVLRAMGHVVLARGSGHRAKIAGYSVGGKSGTAHKIRKGRYDPALSLSSFVAITPLQNPRLIVLVSYDEPASIYLPGEGFNHRGSFCAAPTAALIAKEALRTFNIARDESLEPSRWNAEAPKDSAGLKKPFLYDEARELNEKFDLLHQKGP